MRDKSMVHLDKAKAGKDLSQLGIGVGETIRIPLRVPAGASMPFSTQDTVLQSGDVVFLEARDEEVFYTAGLSAAGQARLAARS